MARGDLVIFNVAMAKMTLTEYKSLVTITDSTWVPRHRQGLLLGVHP